MPDQISYSRTNEDGFVEREGADETPESASQRANPATVVIADDDDAFRETLRIWLSDTEQWTTREASNGQEALDNLDDAVDVLVLDRTMPLLSGPEVVEQLPDTQFGGATIVLSAEGPDSSLSEDEVEGYLIKPISRGDFLDQIARCLH